MKYTNEVVLLSMVILAVFLFVRPSKSGSDEMEVLEMNMDCETIYRSDTVYSSSYSLPELVNQKYKIVAYVDQRVIMILRDWSYYIDEYDNVPFIFYIRSKDKAYVQRCIEEYDFPVPVFIENEDDKNNLFISFILNEKNEIIECTNPSMPGFGKKLKKLSAEM